MNMNESNWVKAYIIDVLPCITVAIYVLAFIYNMSFFSVFNINSVQYISLSEMLLSIIEPLMAFVFLSLIISWLGLWYFTYYLPLYMYHVIESERKEKKTKKRKIPRKLLKIAAKIKETSLFKFLKKLYDWNKKSESQAHEINKKRKMALEKNENYHSWGSLFYAIFIALFSFFAFFALKDKGYIGKGFIGASIGLALPIITFVIMSIGLLGTTLLFNKKSKIKIKKYKTIEVVEMIIVFYLYAIVIFYISGNEYGNFIKNNDIATFEIKTSDGEHFCDSTYRYVNIMNDKIFLLEKETGNNIVINQDAISSIKINYKEEANKSIIVSSLNICSTKTKQFIESRRQKQKNDN